MKTCGDPSLDETVPSCFFTSMLHLQILPTHSEVIEDPSLASRKSELLHRPTVLSLVSMLSILSDTVMASDSPYHHNTTYASFHTQRHNAPTSSNHGTFSAKAHLLMKAELQPPSLPGQTPLNATSSIPQPDSSHPLHWVPILDTIEF